MTLYRSLPYRMQSPASMGCFATWDPTLEGLITTVTGSARPVDNDSITENDLAIIAGVRPDFTHPKRSRLADIDLQGWREFMVG